MHLFWRNIEKEITFAERGANWRVNLTIKGYRIQECEVD
jgi:hypothetical protein